MGNGAQVAALARTALLHKRKPMEEFYLQIRAVHIGAVIASGLLFFARAAARNLLS